MALEFLQHCTFTGPALPEPFVRFEMENELSRLDLLPKMTGDKGRELSEFWIYYRRKLYDLGVRGGELRVNNHVIIPLLKCLGYDQLRVDGKTETREGWEEAGSLMTTADGSASLRVWCINYDEDLDAPARRGAAYRFSHQRIAQRVLLTKGERLGLLTNGSELRLLLSDPARPDSQIIIPIDTHWKRSRELPDSFRLLLALASPKGVQALPELLDKARLQQARVTKELRVQARQAVERFIQEVLDHPENTPTLAQYSDQVRLAKDLWHEGLITVYRLLFVLKLESNDDPARLFSFASGSLWRNTFSPSVALAPLARAVLDRGAETGRMLEDGLRNLFRLFAEGLECTEMPVKPLGGNLFGRAAAPILSSLHWGERAVAHLLDQLLWTSPKRGSVSRERVHYGPLDVEDLGRVYEALLELEPGIATEMMCRLRRQKLEVVVPAAQGEKYRPQDAPIFQENGSEDEDSDEPAEDAEEETAGRGKKTKVEWIEAIPAGRFYLRVGLGRKATGSFYTPHSFVRFLVQETLGPQVEERSPKEDPNPGKILSLKVLDPAMGSGHFLVEACRFLGEKLYEACRLADERAAAAEQRADQEKNDAKRAQDLREAEIYRHRVLDLPDPDDELVRYLPTHAPEGEETGFSQRKALALCRRLVAVHCLYGVDKNPLAVELAKLALWLESHAEGLPLTFLDHRLVMGDSLTGPFFHHLLTYPGSQMPIEVFSQEGLRERFRQALDEALAGVRELEHGVGINEAETRTKEAAKARLDRQLAPFKLLAAAWAGGVMLGKEKCNDAAYGILLIHIAKTGKALEDFAHLDGIMDSESLEKMVRKGLESEALAFELAFPEVFFPSGKLDERRGFDAVLGNPPWDRMLPADKEFFASYEFTILDASTKRERANIQKRLLTDPQVQAEYLQYIGGFRNAERIIDALYECQTAIVNGDKTIGKQDAFRAFMERNAQLLGISGRTGVVVPSAFHANEGATGVRKLYLQQMALQFCYSFENRRKLFEIHAGFKFDLVVASKGSSSTEFLCAFYLHDEQWLHDKKNPEPYRYNPEFVRKTGGEYYSLLELRKKEDFVISNVFYKNSELLGTVCDKMNMRLGRELNMTDDAWRFTSTESVLPNQKDPRCPEILSSLIEQGYFVLHEGKTFWQYNDRWGARPQQLINITNIKDKESWFNAARFYRLAYRAIQNAENERTFTFMIMCPGALFGNSAPCERAPQNTPYSSKLLIQSICSSFSCDWILRLRATANINLFIARGTPIPDNAFSARQYLIHSSLRLSCNHIGYEPLWREQVGDAWREPKPAFTWPVLDGDDERWSLRAAIDAVVADAYGLTREQYAHVLSTFSHKSYPKAPELCLARFDELKEIGLEAFTRKHDPYWDIPLNENLPKPVIDLPIPARDGGRVADGGDGAWFDRGEEAASQGGKRKAAGRRRKTS